METLALAKKLLSIESITPNDNGCQNLIENYLAELGFEIQHFPQNRVSNLWATYGNAPYLCFAGHTDVVPTGDMKAWKFNPFTPTEENGKLYARGAQDMKSSIAAMMVACKRFLNKNPKTPLGVAFLITSDEEGLAVDGTKSVLEKLAQKKVLPKWCLVGEASSSKKLGDTIKVGRRGSLGAKLMIEGKQGHVAYPQNAINPIHETAKVLEKICNIQWDEGNEFFPPTTLQFSNLHAGTGADNVIPGKLEASFNLRFSPAITHTEIQERIEDILKNSQCRYQIEWRLSGKPFLTDSNSQLIKCVSQTIAQVLNIQTEHSTSGGTSDGRFFAEYGVEVVELGPQNNTIHQINECIEIAELEQLSVVYEMILENFASTSRGGAIK